MVRSLTRKPKVVKPRALNRNSDAAKIVESRHIGEETVDWAVVPSHLFKKHLYDTLRHYNHFYENKDHYNWAVAWAKKNNPSLHKKLINTPEWAVSSTVGGLCKIMTNGGILPKRNVDWVASQIQSLPTVESTSSTDRKSPAELVKEKTSDFIALVEQALDQQNYTFDVYDELKKVEAAGITAKRVVEYYTPLLEELDGAINKSDPQLVEGYKHLTIKDKRTVREFINSILDGCGKFLGIKKASRKPRVKKTKSASLKIVKFPFLQESKEYQVASINPINIVGALEVILFNTKTKHMTYLKTNSSKGFDIKGSTILNIDPENSFKKVVRKPEHLTAVLQKPKSGIQRYMQDIKTIKTAASGRSNTDTIILKSFK